MLKNLIKIAELATDFDASGNFVRANQLDQILKAATGWVGIPEGSPMHEELENPDEGLPDTNVDEEMESGRLSERDPSEVDLGTSSEQTFSEVLTHLKAHVEHWLKNHDLIQRFLAQPEPALRGKLIQHFSSEIENILSELVKTSTKKIKWDPEFPALARQIVERVLSQE